MSKTVTTGIGAQTTYEGSVIVRAMERAGKNPHLKGHIHEIMVKDARNLRNVFNGSRTELTRSTTASTVDLVTTKGGKIVERLQLKDTLSDSAVNKLVKQVSEGKYRSAQLIGTDETTQKVNAALKKAGLSKRMSSSGVSSDTTTKIAQRAGATGSGTLGSAVMSAAKGGGAAGAAIGGGIALARGVYDLAHGRRDVADVTIDVGASAIKGGVTGAGSGAAAVGAGAVTAAGLGAMGVTGLAATVATVAAPVAVAVGVGWLISEAWDAIFD